MSDVIEGELAALETMDLAALREAWRLRFGAVPKLRSADLLRRNIAWRIQAAAYGGLDPDTRRRLRAVGGGGTGDGLEPGTKLMREWKGMGHEVQVLEQGYAYAGARYASLSEIARTITGSRWNGPRFFGLRTDAKR